MKRSQKAVLLAEAFVFTMLNIFGKGSDILSGSVFAYPFILISSLLRTLSVSGAAGNAAAVILYCLLLLSPSVYFILRAAKKKVYAEDFMLLIISAVLAAFIFWMINPAYFARHFGLSGDTAFIGAFFTAAVYSLAAGYVIIRSARSFMLSDTEKLLKYLAAILSAVCMVFVFGIFGSGLAGYLASAEQLRLSNTALESSELVLSQIMLFVQYMVSVSAYVMSAIAASAGIRLAALFGSDPFSEELSLLALKTGKLCMVSVTSVIVSQVSVILLQILLGSLIYSGNYTFSIPLFSVLFTLVVLVLAKYFEQTVKLKKDSDSII